jgi:KaiC/GvpD/RAD55 family RecA-like ATPase
MLEGSAQGQRHQVALRLAAHFRWLYPEDIVRNVMEMWRLQVDNDTHPFTAKEMDGIITNCYTGHDGSGYRYGCSDIIMDEYCKNTCKLYKSKKSQTMMDANTMESEFMEFLANNREPLNLGKLYGQDFPIYPGEVVIVQAPPKSMKTMLLQNWVNAFKRPTYFIEMEMSPRQIWSRFCMIEMGWDDEQLANHYAQMQKGMTDKFNWLTVEYGSCYPSELEKRLSLLAIKPEIVVVDHLGLLRSKQRDNNMKVEEASQALMELAVQHNVIVFAVSEITKSAMTEGMNIASSRGSFRIAYNANKVLSITPFKNEDNVIRSLRVESTANREKEWLNVDLPITGVQIR